MGKIPTSFFEYTELFPSLKEATSWKLLRQWSLSEVWRIEMKDEGSLIIKQGKGENSREVSIYTQLLIPLELDLPKVYKAYENRGIGILIMEDLKGKTLEEDPQVFDFIAAAKILSTIRNKSRVGILDGELTNAHYSTFYVSEDSVMNDLLYISRQSESIEAEQDLIFKKALDVLPCHLSRLYKEFPVTLTHNDYHPKNLIKNDDGIAVIDWASAYVSPHLGDLYCLIHSAKDYKIDPDDLIGAYFEETDGYGAHDIEWQVTMGGICWTIHMLRQLLDYGVEAIPIAHEWIPEMISDIRILLDKL